MAEEMVKHIPNARLEIFEESGHFAIVEEPEKYKRVVEKFIYRASDAEKILSQKRNNNRKKLK